METTRLETFSPNPNSWKISCKFPRRKISHFRSCLPSHHGKPVLDTTWMRPSRRTPVQLKEFGWADRGNRECRVEPKYTADRCWGYGVMQVDWCYHKAAIENAIAHDGPYGLVHIRYAAEVFLGSYNVVATRFRGQPGWTEGLLLKAALSGYNAGPNNIQTIENMDVGSANGDYGSDTVTQAYWIYSERCSVEVPPAPPVTTTPSTPPTSGDCPTLPGYVFWPAFDSPLHDIGNQLPSNSPAELAAACDGMTNCKGFNTNGFLKDQIKQVHLWRADFSGTACGGLYTKGGATSRRKVVYMARYEVDVVQPRETKHNSNEDANGVLRKYRTSIANCSWCPGQPGDWCAYFVSWVFKEAGRPIGDNGVGYSQVDKIRDWLVRTNKWRSVDLVKSGEYTPKAGDIVRYNWQHVGILEKVNKDGTYTTLEGNTWDDVEALKKSPVQGAFRRQRRIGEIMGFGEVMA